MTEEPQVFTKEVKKGVKKEVKQERFEGNIIDEYTKRVMKICDAPEIFIRTSAYYIVSGTLGEFFINRLLPEGSQRPNIWAVLSSIPGRTRRSTVQRIAYNVFKAVVGKENAEQMIIESGTPEGIMDQIGEEPNSSYTIQSTEWGMIMEDMKKGDHYSYGVASLLSKLKYGEGGKQSLSQRGGKSKGRSLPEGLYVTMLTGMQEIHNYLTAKQLDQGLPRRMYIVYVPEADRWKKPIDQIRTQVNLNDIINTLRARRQRYLRETKLINSILLPDAEELINNYSKKLDAELDKNKDYASIYKQSLWEHMYEFSTIHAIASREPEMVNNKLLLNVILKDVKAVEPMIKYVEVNMTEVIENLGTVDVPVRVHRTTQQGVYRRIHQVGSEGIGFNKLGKKFQGMDREPLNKLVNNLVSDGDVKWFHLKTGKPGRPPRVLVAKEFIEEFKKKHVGEIVES